MQKLLVSLFLMLSVQVSLAADCDIDLDTLLDRYVEARGGIDALNRQQALRLISTQHEGKWNPKFDYRVMKPGYMWITAIYDDGEVIVEGFDGERGWEKWGEKPAEYVSGAAARGLNQGALSPVHLYGLNHMRDMGAKVSFEGCAVLDGEHYFLLKVVSRFGTDIDYFLDRETYRLMRSRTVRPLHPTQDPTPITIEERWVDFRFVNGVLHPFGFSHWNVETDERLSWLEVHSIEPLDTDPGFFAKPD